MKIDTLARILSISALAIIIGLLAARIPSMSEAVPSFSWPGLFVGVSLVLAAFLLSRFFISGVEANDAKGSPFQRFFLRSGLICFLVALVSFVLILYTQWSWPLFLLRFAVVFGVVSVFAGVFSVLFHRSS